MVTRRAVLGGIGSGGVAFVAGCTDESGDPTTSESTSSSNCRIETRTEEQTLYDEVQDVSAGGTLSWNPDLERGDKVTIDVSELSGARPALEVEASGGGVLTDIGPSSHIQRTLTIDTDGRYYIQLENEALLTSGQWDIVITLEQEIEEEVCN